MAGLVYAWSGGDVATQGLDRWRVRVIDLDGNILGYVRTAKILMIDDPLNELVEARFQFSAYDPTADLLLGRVDDDQDLDMVGCLHREIQILYRGQVIVEGPATRFRENGNGIWEAQVYSFDWWLNRRFVGRADRVNLLVDGGFEDPTLNPAWDPDDVTVIIETAHPVVGDQYARVIGTGYLRQTFDFYHEYPPGLSPVFAVRIYFPSTSAPPPDNIWFTVESDYHPGQVETFKLDPDTIPRDVWTEFVFNSEPLPQLVTWNTTVSLRGVVGTGIDYDDVRSVQPESIGAPFGGADPANVAALLVVYMQRPDNGKDDVRITSVSHPTGGRTDVVWQGANHEDFGRAMRQLYEMEGGVDVWRNFTNRELHYGAMRGSFKPSFPLRSGKTATSITTDIDGTLTATSGVVIGIGQDFTRNEGGHIDSSMGLPILERVDHAPVSMPLREYDSWAQEIIRNRSRTIEMFSASTVWTIDQWLSGGIQTGDTVWVWVDSGEFTSRKQMRIARLTIDVVRGTVVPELVPPESLEPL